MVHQLRNINAQLVEKMFDLLKYEPYIYIDKVYCVYVSLTAEKEMYNSMKRVNDSI